ncbi:MAG: DJ-1/PfpI family protein [Rikenellaceae bacterium]|nr:DJ-1/PfpI family protein [Rikenellaceae bacterium]
MAKKTAVLAVDPVNGAGLFQYLESFYENGIPYTVFAVAESPDIKTNSGIPIRVDGTVTDLKGKADEYEALVFACGDAIPKFNQNADAPYNRDMMEIIKEFGNAGKIMAGHCAAALLFEMAGITDGRRLAIHPFIKGAVVNGTATDELFEKDGNFYTAQTESAIPAMIGELVDILK